MKFYNLIKLQKFSTTLIYFHTDILPWFLKSKYIKKNGYTNKYSITNKYCVTMTFLVIQLHIFFLVINQLYIYNDTSQQHFCK